MQFGASIPRQKFATEFDAIWAASLRWRNTLIGPLSRQFTALRSNPSDAVFHCTEFLTRDTRVVSLVVRSPNNFDHFEVDGNQSHQLIQHIFPPLQGLRYRHGCRLD